MNFKLWVGKRNVDPVDPEREFVFWTRCANLECRTAYELTLLDVTVANLAAAYGSAADGFRALQQDGCVKCGTRDFDGIKTALGLGDANP